MTTRRTTVLFAAFAAALMAGCTELANMGSGLTSSGYPDSSDPYYGRDPYSGRDPYYGRGIEYGEEREWETRAHPPIDCAHIGDRIRLDRQKIAEIDPAKHHKALQWYRDDLQNAERDRDQCRDYEWYRHRQREEARHEEQLRQQAEIQRQQAKCQQIADRMRIDRAKIAEIDPQRHHKALQWYKDDLRNAERDMQSCH
jgi:hypothetical protein